MHLKLELEQSWRTIYLMVENTRLDMPQDLYQQQSEIIHNLKRKA